MKNGSFGTRSVLEDGDGKFWFSKTLHRYAIECSSESASAETSQWYRRESGLGDLDGHVQSEYEVFISSIRGDDGALWLATLGGVVWRYDGKTMTRYPVTEDGERHWIFSIYEDRQGVLWVGTQAHGVYRFNGESFERFEP